MSSIAYKDVESAVSRALGSNLKILSHRLEPFSKDKSGCLGAHYSLKVEVKNETSNANGLLVRTFFVKTFPDSPIIQSILMDEHTFLEEVRFYEEIQSLMICSCKAERWSPRCYLATHDALIFEDLRAQGYRIFPDSLLGEQHLKSALATLARFHASSILVEKRIGRSLKAAYPNAFDEKLYSDLYKFSKGVRVGYSAIAEMAKRFGLDSSLVPKIYEQVCRLVRTEEGACNVVCHGDLWMNNLMFDSSVPPKCILVDFQFLRYASPTIDLAMILYLHTTPQDRKKSEIDMFKYYYSNLRETLVQNDGESILPAYEAILKDYQKRRLVGMTFASLYLPGVYLKPEDLAEILNNPVTLEKWFLHNRNDIIQSNMDTDPTYEEKLKDIVSELLEEGKRILDE